MDWNENGSLEEVVQPMVLPMVLPKNSDILQEIVEKKQGFSRCNGPIILGIIKEVHSSLVAKWNTLGIPTMQSNHIQKKLSDIAKKPNSLSLGDVCYIAKCNHYRKAKTALEIGM